MKKLLGIIITGLVLCTNSFAGVEEVLKEIKKNKDRDSQMSQSIIV